MNTKIQSTETIYTSSMHIDINSDKPGKCSKCGINLVEEKE